MTRESEIRCPKCGSGQITAHKRGLSLKNAAIGAGVGLLTAGIGIGAAAGALVGINNVVCTCIACGHQWKAGTVAPTLAAEDSLEVTYEVRGLIAPESERTTADRNVEALRRLLIDQEVRKGMSVVEAEKMAKELYR